MRCIPAGTVLEFTPRYYGDYVMVFSKPAYIYDHGALAVNDKTFFVVQLEHKVCENGNAWQQVFMRDRSVWIPFAQLHLLKEIA